MARSRKVSGMGADVAGAQPGGGCAPMEEPGDGGCARPTARAREAAREPARSRPAARAVAAGSCRQGGRKGPARRPAGAARRTRLGGRRERRRRGRGARTGSIRGGEAPAAAGQVFGGQGYRSQQGVGPQGRHGAPGFQAGIGRAGGCADWRPTTAADGGRSPATAVRADGCYIPESQSARTASTSAFVGRGADEYQYRKPISPHSRQGAGCRVCLHSRQGARLSG